MTGDPDDDLVLRIDVSRFKDARDVLPRPARLSYGALTALVAPEQPPVRADLVQAERKRLRVVDDAVRVLQAGEEATGWLGDHPTYRAIERAAWTAGEDPDDRLTAIRAAADAARDRIRRGTKTRLPCWSPVRCHPASTRGVPAVEHVTCLVLDYDDGTAIDAAVAPWTDWPLLVATTWSHTREAPRFRVVLVLDRPVPAELWPRAWAWAAERAAGTVDPACKDPSRLYLLPALRGPRAPYRRVVHDPGGQLLDLDWERLPPAEPARTPHVEADPATHRARPPADPSRARARKVLRRDGEARRRAAEWLSARISGRRAERATCPACGRASVWFWIEPGALSTAQCHHKNSCGWWGHLDELLDAHGGRHAG